jgi:hypothetical protein
MEISGLNCKKTEGSSHGFAPIALFAFRRPNHLHRTVQSLLSNSLASQSDLYVFCDGPRTTSDAILVNEVRGYAKGIRGFRSLTVIEQSENLGLATSIYNGVSKLCDEYGKVIVVEDDLFLNREFLAFLNQGISLYSKNPKVYQISGYMYPLTHSNRLICDSFFLPVVSCWGWATWSSAWQDFNLGKPTCSEFLATRESRRRFNLDGAYNYYQLLVDQKKGRAKSWGVLWYEHVFSKDGVVLYPRHSLVTNVGCDGSGVNGLGHSFLQLPEAEVASNPMPQTFPGSARANDFALEALISLLRSGKRNFCIRIIHTLLRL